MGIGEDSKVTLIAIGAFFPVFTTVSVALRQVDPHSVEMARSFSLRGFALFRTVQLPAVVPSIMSGLRLALAQCWLFLVAAELIAASMGLGWLLTDSQSTGRVDQNPARHRAARPARNADERHPESRAEVPAAPVDLT